METNYELQSLSIKSHNPLWGSLKIYGWEDFILAKEELNFLRKTNSCYCAYRLVEIEHKEIILEL